MMYGEEQQQLLLHDYLSNVENNSEDEEDVDFNSISDYWNVTIDAWKKLINSLLKTEALLLCFLTIAILTIFGKLEYVDTMNEIEDDNCHDVLADCPNVSFNQTVIPPFVNYLQDFTISKKHSLSFCLIPKVISTVGTGMMCYLNDADKFTRANRTISDETYMNRFCEENEMKSYRMVENQLKKFENIIVVRDPIDRFISGFTEKCVAYSSLNYCHECGTDIKCFIRKEYRRLKRISMLFPVYTVADTHFAPQTWFCDMRNTMKKSTIIKYGNVGEERTRMINDILKVLERNNVTNEEMDNVRKELSKGKTHHSTIGSNIRNKYEVLIRNDNMITRALIRMYYHDFQIFGYDM